MTTRTGWKEVDEIFDEIDRLVEELEEIRKEAADILYSEGRKPADSKKSGSKSKRQLVRTA